MDEALKTQLTELGFNEEMIGKLEAQGVNGLPEISMLSEQEIREISGCTVIAAKKAVSAFAPKAPEPVETATTDNSMAIQTVLPALPDETSFIEMLKVGGVLKIDRTNAIAAVRAAIASDVGLFDLPDKLVQRMEDFANEQEEPLGDAFYRLQKQLAQRRYGDVLTALGTTASFVSEKRKKETLSRLHMILWPALNDFYNQLDSWVKLWSQGANNPVALVMAMAAKQGTRGVMPPGMFAPPETSALRDEAEAVINRMNKVFAGAGIPTARALAFDAKQIRDVLEDPGLPSTIGAATHDQMLKMLGIGVGADIVRLEQSVARFTLAIMELSKIPTGDEELMYLSAMYTLGAQIPWNKLGTSLQSTPTFVSNPRKNTSIRGDEQEK